MTDRSEVDIDALVDAGKVTYTQIASDYNAGMRAAQSKIMSAYPGAIGTNEAQTCADGYFASIEALSQFINESSMGCPSLGFGLIAIAANYREGDLSQAEAMSDVIAAFNPGPGAKTVAGWFAEHGGNAKPAQPVLGKTFNFPAPGSPAYVAANEPDDLPEDVYVPPSADEQRRLHDKVYGDDERWRPLDPNLTPPPECATADDPNASLTGP